MKVRSTILTVLYCVAAFSAGAQGLQLHFRHYVWQQPLVLDSAVYLNAAGESMRITRFRYYVSNVVLFSKGKPLKQPGYFLIDEAVPSSKIVSFKKVGGAVDSIQFIVGVDSMRSCAGAQTGSLDPLKGMYWTWKSGYIFLKLEGSSPASSLRGNMFEYHIGGYKAPANCIRVVRLPVSTTGTKSSVNIQVDVGAFFSGGISIARLPSVTGIDHAAEAADHIPGMFSVNP